MPIQFTPTAVTIASGAALSDSVNLGWSALVAVIMPAAWTAADLTFQVSDDGGTTWRDLYDNTGTEFTITAAASRFIYLNTYLPLTGGHIRVRSGTTGTPVNQGADREIKLVIGS